RRICSRYSGQIAEVLRRSRARKPRAAGAKLAGTARLSPPHGAIAQLGERLDRTQEVAGSSPASSISLELPCQLRFAGTAIPQLLRDEVAPYTHGYQTGTRA